MKFKYPVGATPLGYMSADVAAVFKNVILPCLVQTYAKRSIKDVIYDQSIGALNYYEIKCHVCMQYCGWSKNFIKSIDSAQSDNVDKEKGA